jgi:hypothetical protein
MSDNNLAETITVVGSGASVAAGATTTLVSAVQAAGVMLPTLAVTATGIGAFVIGGIGAYLLKDRILKMAEKDARHIEQQRLHFSS